MAFPTATGADKYQGHQRTETDQERFARTALSSAEMTDKESAAVQKTPNRVSLDSIKAKIAKTEIVHPAIIPHMTLAILQLENGFVVVGQSAPADPANFNDELGTKFAIEDAVRQIWKLEAYLLREQMFRGEGNMTNPEGAPV